MSKRKIMGILPLIAGLMLLGGTGLGLYITYQHRSQLSDKQSEIDAAVGINNQLTNQLLEQNERIDDIVTELSALTKEIKEITQETEGLAKVANSLSDKNLRLTEKIDNWQTGGESTFCYLMPTPSFRERGVLYFNLTHQGEYPMHNIHMKVWDESEEAMEIDAKLPQRKFSSRKEYEDFMSKEENKKKQREFDSAIFRNLEERLLVDNKIAILLPNSTSGVLDEPAFKFSFPNNIDKSSFVRKYSANFNARNGVYQQIITIKYNGEIPYLHSIVYKKINEKEREVVKEFETTESKNFILKIIK